jgi:hypothetical protein
MTSSLKNTSSPPRAAAAWLLLAALTAARADDEISTDRPDFVESSLVVGRGAFQVETSLTGESDHRNGLHSRTTVTPTLLRFGVSDTVELRLETEGFTRITDRDAAGIATTTRGFADVAVGLKWHAADADEATGRPSMAWLVDADLPSGSSSLRGQGVRPALRFVAEWELPGDLSVGVMPGVFVDRDDQGQRYTAGLAAVTVGKDLGGPWRGFGEIAAQRIAPSRHGGSAVTFDFGVARALGADAQIDAAIALGLNRNTPDVLWTIGYSVRFR